MEARLPGIPRTGAYVSMGVTHSCVLGVAWGALLEGYIWSSSHDAIAVIAYKKNCIPMQRFFTIK